MMATINTRLKIYFEMRDDPTDAEIEAFYEHASYLAEIQQKPMESVSYAAALEIFKGVGSAVHGTEADTIEMLLKQIKGA